MDEKAKLALSDAENELARLNVVIDEATWIKQPPRASDSVMAGMTAYIGHVAGWSLVLASAENCYGVRVWDGTATRRGTIIHLPKQYANLFGAKAEKATA